MLSHLRRIALTTENCRRDAENDPYHGPIGNSEALRSHCWSD